MKRISITILLIILGTSQVFGASPVLRRFALIAGSNDGGPERIELRYATKDARSFDRVMNELGGVRESDRILLTDPSVREFMDALFRIRELVAATDPGERRELVVYYSGHSDESGLLLGSGTLPYKALRDAITEVPADVRLAILDSCSSGVLTRSKGGVHRPAFLMDEASDMKGYAFLTSSSADEAAQESDRIGSSFFTHYLISALRGAADATGDGYITLNEAYHFAFTETLASTQSTQYGPQHPAYDISLSGTGDLVITDLRETSEGLIIPENLGGRFYIRDSAGNLVVELNKTVGQKIELGINPGVYSIILDQRGELFEGKIRINQNRYNSLSPAGFHPIAIEQTAARGQVPEEPSRGSFLPDTGLLENDESLRFDPFHFSFLPEVYSRPDGLHTVSVNMLWGNVGAIHGVELGAVINRAVRDVVGFQAAGVGNMVDRNVRGYQTSGVFNIVRGDVRLVQTAGIINITFGGFYGFQGSGIVNYVGMNTGGVQAAGVVSLAGLDVSGVQASGVVNIAGSTVTGTQLGGVFNYAREDVTGAQVSGVANYVRRIRGAQVSLVNISSTVTGAQIGLINIAGVVRGTQIGLINISREMNGVPFGLLSLSRDGQQHLEIWRSLKGSYQAAFRLGTRYAYTLFRFGYEQDSDPVRWSYGLGFGIHLPFYPFYVNVDASIRSMHEGFDEWYDTDAINLLPELRAVAGFRFGSRIALFAGGSVRFFFPGGYPDPDVEDDPNRVFHMKPSVIIGAQL